MSFFSTTKTIGILGGGQLGKMLLNTTRQWDIKTHVLDPNEFAPARVGSNTFVQGDLMDYKTVVDFGEKVDILTIEIENINSKAFYGIINIYPNSILIIFRKCNLN